nr:hypothetical protein CFP56_55666 [Quercus suber]
MPRRLRRAHKPQAVVGEVVGLEGVDVVEVVEVVMRMRMTRMMRCWRATGACTWMALGHRDALLTLLPSHPTPLAMTIVQNSHPVLKLALSPHHPLNCLPHCSAALPTTIEQIQSENIGQVHGLRRSILTDIHPPGCGTGDGKTRPAKSAVRKQKQC